MGTSPQVDAGESIRRKLAKVCCVRQRGRSWQLWTTCNEPRFGDSGDLLVMLGDFEHPLPRHGIVELVRDAARLFRAAPPVRGVVQKMIGHMGSTAATKLRSSIDQRNAAAYGP